MTLSIPTTTQTDGHTAASRDRLKNIDMQVREIALAWESAALGETVARAMIAEIAAGIPIYGAWVPDGDNGEDVRSETRLEMMRRIMPEPGAKISSSKLNLAMVAGGTSFTGWYLNSQAFVGPMVARTHRKRNAIGSPIVTVCEDPGALHTPGYCGAQPVDPLLTIASAAVQDYIPRVGGIYEVAARAALIAHLWSLPTRTYGPARDSLEPSVTDVAEVRRQWRKGTPPLVAVRWSAHDIDWFLAQDRRLIQAVIDGSTAERNRRKSEPAMRQELASLVPYPVDDGVVHAYMRWVEKAIADPDDFVRILDRWAAKAGRQPESVKADLDAAFDTFERRKVVRNGIKRFRQGPGPVDDEDQASARVSESGP